MADHAVLLTVSGRDRPGLTAAFCATLAEHRADILDIEQALIRDQLTLGILIEPAGDPAPVLTAAEATAAELGVAVEFSTVSGEERTERVRHAVTVLGHPLRASALAAVAGRIAAAGANIERIHRLSRYPVRSFELLVSGGDADALRRDLAAAAVAEQVDVAVQRATLYRRAKRLICLDVDSTLVQDEVIELLARHAGCGDAVAEITERAMAGEIDFEAALRERVALLEGLQAEALDRVREEVRLTPGARTVIRTLSRLGFTTAIVSGGFTQVTEHLQAELGIDYGTANTLEVADGRLTGRLTGAIIDRAGKAAALERFAEAAGVPLHQVVAVGDGANDLDMLNRAGLGIAFNAKPVVRAAADTSVSVPFLDAILFLLGITREEIEAADAEDPGFAPVAARMPRR